MHGVSQSLSATPSASFQRSGKSNIRLKKMPFSPQHLSELAVQIKQWGRALGFQRVGITDTNLTQAENRLFEWLENGMHGQLHYMEKHGLKRTRPADLIPGTVRIISARMDYLPPDSRPFAQTLADSETAYISRYATGRDYHKLIRKRLERLARRINREIGPFNYRAFADSAPVMEKPLAQKAGLGWIGKHTNLLSRESGSWFFIGELYIDLPLPCDLPSTDHCGSCVACISACPTNAIVKPYLLDARKCISYWTIEHRGSIPTRIRPFVGNRIFGCDDCQIVCPWNRFSSCCTEPDFRIRHQLDSRLLADLFSWTEEEFLEKTRGSAIRRLGHELWLRNIAVALGNAQTTAAVVAALESRQDDASEIVKEHVLWGLEQHCRAPGPSNSTLHSI